MTFGIVLLIHATYFIGGFFLLVCLRFPLGPGRAHIWTVYNVKIVKTDQHEVLLLEACIDLYGEQACYCYFILDKAASVVTQCSLREAP